MYVNAKKLLVFLFHVLLLVLDSKKLFIDILLFTFGNMRTLESIGIILLFPFVNAKRLYCICHKRVKMKIKKKFIIHLSE